MSFFFLCSQSQQERAYLCLHHGLSHCALPAAHLRALLPPDDPQMHGDWDQAVWDVSGGLPQRVGATLGTSPLTYSGSLRIVMITNICICVI